MTIVPSSFAIKLLSVVCFVLSATVQVYAEAKSNLVVAVAEIPQGLEPAFELSNVGTRVTYNIFDTLIRRNFLSDGSGTAATLVPHLAAQWKRIPENGLELTLQKGVLFHNGEELTSADVVFTFDRILAADTPLKEAKGYFEHFDRVEAPDRYTVRVYTKGYDPILEQRLASWATWIVNKKAYEEMGYEKFSRSPVGTGPYKVKSLRTGEGIELEAHAGYFMGKPTVDRISFVMVPEQTARISGLVSGEYDIITNVSPDQIPLLNNYGDIEARSVVLANSHVLVFNESHPLLADKRIRQALSCAIDRNTLVKSLWNDQAVVPLGYQYPEFGSLYEPGRKGFAYDPDKARVLLKEAGYTGQTITYHTQAHYYLNALQAAQIMQEMWKAVGLNVELQVIDNFKQVNNEQIMIRNWSNSSRYPDPAGSIALNWAPSGNPQRVWKTFVGAGAKAFNETIEALNSSRTPEERKQAFMRMMDVWQDDVPGTILYQPLETYGAKKSVSWKPYSFYYMDLRPYNLKIQ